MFSNLAASTSGSITSSISINASGVIQYSVNGANTPINDAVYWYGGGSLSASDTTFVANHFTLLDVDWSTSASNLQNIKTRNSNMKVIGYKGLSFEYSYDEDWSTVNANENWFIHDVSGNRIVDTIYNGFLMDVGNAGWRQHWASYVNNKMATSSVWDGVFADGVYATMSNGGYNSAIPNSVIVNWHSNMIGMLQFVKANLASNKLLIINTDDEVAWGYTDHDYIDIADGRMIEAYCHATWEAPSDLGRTTWTLTTQIAALARDSGAGKIVWAASGVSGTVTSQMVKWCYAMYLLGINGPQAYFGFNDIASSDGSKGYYSIMDTNIGSPSGAYYTSQNVYMRDYTSGKVLFNPSANYYAINLGATYRLLDGTLVTSVTLNPYSGEILTT